MTGNKVRIPDVLRSDVQIRADTVDEEARTVEIVWAAGAPVQRYDWWERENYIEELSMDPGAIRMDRFAAGMSLLDSHNPYSMDDRLGVVLPGSVRVENGLGIATVQFSRKPRAEELFQDVIDGMPFPVSVGYRTHSYERTEASDTSIARLTAIDWEPMELSAVPIPADPAAHSRGEAPGQVQKFHDVAVMSRSSLKEGRMPSQNNRAPERDNSLGLPLSTRQAEMTRIFPKEDAVRAFVAGREDIDSEAFVAETRGMNELQIRAALLDHIVERQERTPTFPHAPARAGAADRRSEIEVRGEAIYARANPAHRLSEQGRQFAHMRFSEHARDCLRHAGENVTGLSDAQLVTRALHATSDFPLILGIAGERALRAGYEVQDSELRKTARQSTLSDFRTHYAVNLSAAPSILKVNEHGEYKRGTLRESQEGYGLSTYGRIIGLTRQLLINDDLGAFARIAPAIGRKARDFEIASLAAIIEANPIMSDGLSVFSAEHGNLGAAASLSVESLSAARLAMRKQTGLAGESIGVRPKYLVVPSELETIAEKVLTQIAATKVSDVNPFAARLELIVEHRLSDPSAWFLAADPNEVDGLEFAHLAGEEGVHMETKAGWDVDGIEIKARLDFGAGWIDHRGWYRNPGQ
ncbi:prohead protease/major capsid protein fusion protein [Aureimonas sp. AU20]|uniref:prohead protease/major capsid protein fusion protein n=1 Tax=Aureimonas sp. AU20 TaxID=1349819 RepID=UPI000720AC8D|nr:prohead protease/major capsid protein fusion protein [Aureimonas sp. AU20]ALN73189.1 hypothetical protein M673_10690 [Aureimonas sp. AU20]